MATLNGRFCGAERPFNVAICIVFYAAISARDKNSINKTFDTKGIDSITMRKIKADLDPVIRTKDDFDLESAKKLVKDYISDLMVLTK